MEQVTIKQLIANGGYNTQQGGYIFTHTITVETSRGMVTGEIGTKTQYPPYNVEDQIWVEIKQDGGKTKIKKVNPKYAGNNAPPPDNVQDSIKFGQASNLAMIRCQIEKSALNFEKYQSLYYKFLINRKMPVDVTTAKATAVLGLEQNFAVDQELDDGIPF